MSLEAAVEQLTAEMGRFGVPGLEVAVVRSGEVLVADGFGVRGVEDAAPAGSGTWFHHGSCGKALTGLLATVLAEAGILDLDAPVRRYLPELRLPDPVIADRVTTRDLLGHRSGLGRHDLTWILNPSRSRDELVRRMEHLPLAADLRSRWLYSNLGYTTAGLAMGRAAGSTWEDQLSQRVLEPAGMKRTSACLSDVTSDPDHARPHLTRNGSAVPTAFRSGEAIAPAGGVLSCAEDSARWLLALTAERDGPISPAAVRATQEIQTPVPAVVSPFPELRFLFYGMGWVLGTLHGRPIVWHNGGIDGFRTDTLLVPDAGLGILVSTNLHDTSLSLAAVLSMAAALLDQPVEPSWYDRLRPKASDDEAAGTAGPDGKASSAPGPAHALTEYAATYEHPGYGAVVVGTGGGGLTVRVGECDLACTHRHYDTWDLRYEPLELDLTITFFTDADGTVAEAVLPLDAETGPVRFHRQAPPTAGK